MKLFIIFLIFTSLFNPVIKFTDNRLSLGTMVNVTLFAKRSEGAKLLEELYKKTDEYEKIFSSRNENGLVFKLNKNGGGKLNNTILNDVLLRSIEFAKITNSAFDPALYPLISLWDIESSKVVPNSEAIKKAQELSGYSKIAVKDDELFLEKGAGIDLGAMAKGVIIDLLAEYLHQSGCNDFIINAGGDLAVSGLFNKKRLWKISISNPYNHTESIGSISLTNSSIVTSGDYERFFIGDDGKEYHHILDIKTGFPSRSGINSITVISNNATDADVFSTAFFVMGREKAILMAETLDNIEIICVEKDENDKMKISVSSGIDFVYSEEFGYNFSLKNNNWIN